MNRTLLFLSYLLYLPLVFLLPLILKQAKHTRRTALRLPEAKGERSGEYLVNNQMAKIKLLHLGESTVAGVGVENTNQGFSAQISEQLTAKNMAHEFAYIAKTGLTSAELIEYLEAQTQEAPECTHLLITLGVNDTTCFSSLNQWRKNLEYLVAKIRKENPNCQVFFTQVPPMQRFPALAKPLNYFLGLRAWQLNHELKHLCAKKGWQLAQIDIPLQPQWMAKDGYHPNQAGYEIWAKGVAEIMFF